ncbi:mitochondrial import inner membrane translocase subunit tim21 [Lithohypha guttulata]|uniref:Mitochondrial import inner membrane translocase subunit Tim21 n=1 Tax=Lithohypha guttulata TaxID=1690604 RepID=A0AAN7T0W7_9EURO|nr:mitochondrial import inner membrane translocase subunit tim21 [Lithohypha guttulata]KAK5097099.1 mitochondrial import inner membrane translocase subunit tim21 [Lithohypha guttulata]
MPAKLEVLQTVARTLPSIGETAKPALARRWYATHTTSGRDGKPTRRAISITSDDGRYAWSELSRGEKAARTTQQSFNFVFVTAGAIGTICVGYLLYQELFAADSKTVQFNQAVDRIKADPRCREMLGPSNKMVFHGEATTSKWARSRPLAHSLEVDRFGTTHFRMHFYVEGTEARGTVNIHMTKKSDATELQYRLLSVSVPGKETIYLENADAKSPKTKVAKMFGVQWK